MALTTAFARNGNRKAVPQTSQDGSVSYDQGFGSFYALPPEEGGLFIDRAQFNQIMYDTTSAVISNQNSINSLNSSVNTLNEKVADIEGGVATGVVNLTTNQTIGGVKTFSAPPVSATNPTNNNQVANKAYVDSVGRAKVATTTYNADKATFATKTELNTKAGFVTKTLAIGANEELKNLNDFRLFALNNFANYYILSITSDIEINKDLDIWGLRFGINSTRYKIKVKAPISISNSSISLGAVNFEFGTGSTDFKLSSSHLIINGDMNITDNAGADVSDHLFFINNCKVAFGVGDTGTINSPKATIFALSGGSTLAFLTMNISGNIGGNLVSFFRPSLLFSSGTNFNNLAVIDIAKNTLTNKGIWFNA